MSLDGPIYNSASSVKKAKKAHSVNEREALSSFGQKKSGISLGLEEEGAQNFFCQPADRPLVLNQS